MFCIVAMHATFYGHAEKSKHLIVVMLTYDKLFKNDFWEELIRFIMVVGEYQYQKHD